MIKLTTPRGLSVDVPETGDEDVSPKFDIEMRQEIRSYYEKNGYVVVKSAISPDACDEIRGLWEREVKPSRAYIYRQATAKAERHVFNDRGWIMNPILNLQSVDVRKFPEFRAFATNQILTDPSLMRGFSSLFDESPKIVQSMYFEGNSATWEHQDSYYLDSERIGTMCAAWIAVEDISATAGRFFVCPGSHKIEVGRHDFKNNIAEHHEAYIQSVVEKAKKLKLEIRAPKLEKGDVLFWNAWTIHGSLDSQDEQRSRSSITCHAIPASHRFLQHQTRIVPLKSTVINGIEVHRPKDLAKARYRAIFTLESKFPSIFYWLKRNAIKWRFKLRSTGA